MSARRWPSYGAIWRWHFYAGLLCIPFVLWLATTGSIYLFRPQIETLIDRPFAHVGGPGARASAAAQAEAAVRAVPGSVLHQYQLPDTPDQAVQILVGQGAREMRVYVHPQDLRVLKVVEEDSRLMPTIFRLHGELLIGNTGSYIVELAASWAIVMILSGLFLWWPRGKGLAGVLWPRLDNRRWRWRDLHAVTGFWVSAFALAFLFSGLPWAKSWGDYLQVVRAVGEPRISAPDWALAGSDALRARAAADAGARQALGGHAGHDGMAMPHMAMAPSGSNYAPLDRLVGVVRPLDLAAPVLIAPPAGPGEAWSARSDAANRPLRASLTLDGASGTILTRENFPDRPMVDRIVGYGVAAHEGQLFGWVNQLLNLATAFGLILLAVSSTILWWRRRPDGVLGAPPIAMSRPVSIAFVCVLACLGVLLPLMGLSMLVVLLTERILLRRMNGPARWLGLRPLSRARGMMTE